MAKWICSACGEAENCDAHCSLETPTSDKPEFCPVTGDECEWYLGRMNDMSETKEGYGWCQSCGALVFNSSRCHKCDGKVKSFCVDIQLVKQAERIKELKAYLIDYGTHKRSCAYAQGLRGSTIEKCDCGFEQALKG